MRAIQNLGSYLSETSVRDCQKFKEQTYFLFVFYTAFVFNTENNICCFWVFVCHCLTEANNLLREVFSVQGSVSQTRCHTASYSKRAAGKK